jgi:hypothetical protein
MAFVSASRILYMRWTVLLLTSVLAASPVVAAPLAYPVRHPGDILPAPYYEGDVLEIQLAPVAAREALPLGAGRTRAGRVTRVGVAAVDATAAALGASFEAEFVGEAPPDPATGGMDFTGFRLVHLPAGVGLEDALARFRALPEVVTASPIAVMPTSTIPNDSLFTSQHWLHMVSTPRHDSRASEAWDVERGDTSIVIAILDTGVLPYHPDLGGTVAGGHGNLWTNWAEANGQPGVDDDGNGYVDDVWGWDFVATTGTDSARADPGEDATVQDNDPNDYAGHGTLVAGVIGAIANNVSGVAGVVPNVRMMVVRMGWFPRLGTHPAGNVRMDFAAQAIRYATLNGASVINCSWSSDYLASLDSAVTAATRAGVTVVTASGNFGSPAYLGGRDDVISVAATDSTDVYWIGDVTGPWLDLCAAGVDMTSTSLVAVSADSLGSRQPSYVTGMDGTSFAAPQVAGAAALLQARRLHLGLRRLTPLGVRLRLMETGDDVHAVNFNFTDIRPRLNLLRALTDPPTSTATRTLSRAVGSPLVLRYSDGRSLIVLAMASQQLVAYDGATMDTAWIAALPGLPSGNPAGARLGPGRGVGIFVGTENGRVAGFADDGTPLPGWPVSGPGAAVRMSGGVALADMDGDGLLDVVSMGSNGRLWAWNLAGAKLSAGFPFVTGILGASDPAFAELDGLPGAEALCLDGFGILHAVDHTGGELWQWTAPSNASAPVVTRLGGPGAPLGILVCDPTGVTALDASGAVLWNTPLPVNTAVPPALADLDGDGVDELVVSAGSPASFSRVDSAGSVVAAPGWPAIAAAEPQGPIVAGPLRANHTCVGAYGASGFAAVDDAGQTVAGFPHDVPGAGFSPTLADPLADGVTRVVAGTASDSNVVVFTTAPGTWDPSRAAWPTARGNGARTGSRVYTAGAATIDVTPPAAVADLAATPRDTTGVALSWTATGDDGAAGRAARVELRRSAAPIDDSNFAAATIVPGSGPSPAGSPDSALVTGLPEGSTWWFRLRAWDAAGNASALSNLTTVTLPSVAPATVADLAVTALADTVATLGWTAVGDNGAIGRPARYEIAADPAPIAGRFDAAALHVSRAATVDAGGAESASVAGLTRGRRWYFLVRAVDAAGNRSGDSNAASVLVPVGGALRGRTGVAVAARLRPSRLPVALDWQGADAGGAQSLALYDLSGRLVRRAALGSEPGGSWTWDGRDEQGRVVPAGLYLARLTSGGRHAEARVMLLR